MLVARTEVSPPTSSIEVGESTTRRQRKREVEPRGVDVDTPRRIVLSAVAVQLAAVNVHGSHVRQGFLS